MTVEIIQQYYAAFNAGDWPGLLGLLADDVAHDLNQGRREVGRTAFALFLARMQRSYRERLEDLVVLAAPGRADRFAAEWTVHGEYLVADARVTNCYNLEAWLEQVR